MLRNIVNKGATFTIMLRCKIFPFGECFGNVAPLLRPVSPYIIWLYVYYVTCNFLYIKGLKIGD